MSPTAPRIAPVATATVMPCLRSFRAVGYDFAPISCEASTEYPVIPADPRPQKSQIVLDTIPTAAASTAPRLPTMAASMYCIKTFANCARIAGIESRITRASSSARVKDSPDRIFPISRWETLSFIDR